MQLVHDNLHMSQRETAKAFGISFWGIYNGLNALIEKRLVKIHNFSQNQNRFCYAYLLISRDISDKAVLTGGFLKRKLQENKVLQSEINALNFEIETEQGRKPNNI
jgi:EPS-associated MarR family transcriptional regulator